MWNETDIIFCWNTVDVIAKTIMVRLHHKFKSYQTFPTLHNIGLHACRLHTESVMLHRDEAPAASYYQLVFIFVNLTINQVTKKILLK